MSNVPRPPLLGASGKAIRRARELRRTLSKPEIFLWQRLRGQLGVERWRKQHPLGKYTLDFLNVAGGLVVEIDGQAHDPGDRPARDERRDAWLRTQGLRVERVAARDVLRDADGVADALMRLAAECRSTRG